MLKKSIQDPDLVHEQCYIDGSWSDASDGASMEVLNPANGKRLGNVPSLTRTDVDRAIQAADSALPAWRNMSAQERSDILRQWQSLLMDNQDDLAHIMTAEQGKPLSESQGEIRYAASFIEWFAEEAKRIYGDLIPPHQTDKRLLVLKQPVGVCAAITPWNFPSAMIARKVGPALAAGCTMVVKPASATPYSALALAELGHRAGIPPGVFNVVTGSADIIGHEFTSHPLIRKLTFTGSTETGKALLANCAGTLKKVTMELGGNAPFIVFDDADLDAAVDGAIASKFRNNGQTCVCANRFLVQEGIYQTFSERLADKVKFMTVGPGDEDDTQLGPLINMNAVESVEELLADAVHKGATILTGGKRHALGRTFFEPTVLINVTEDMDLADREIFGPVAPLFRFKSEQDAIRLANDTDYGLASYFYTRDLARSWRVREALEYGIVGVNTGLISTAVAPFGGIKHSGLGREGSKYGIDGYLEIKYVCIGAIN